MISHCNFLPGLEFLREGAVLDVAGGKGELAWELLNCMGVRATVVDPRPLVLGALDKKWRQGMFEPRRTGPVFCRWNPSVQSGASATPAPGLEIGTGHLGTPHSGLVCSPWQSCGDPCYMSPSLPARLLSGGGANGAWLARSLCRFSRAQACETACAPARLLQRRGGRAIRARRRARARGLARGAA